MPSWPSSCWTGTVSRTIGQASLVYTAPGQAHAAAGQLHQALGTLELGLVLRRTTSSHGPWATNHHLLIHARVAAEAGRPACEGSSRRRRLTVAAVLTGMTAMRARLERHAATSAPTATGRSGRTADGPEIDILRLLQGSMSLHEIANGFSLLQHRQDTLSRGRSPQSRRAHPSRGSCCRPRAGPGRSRSLISPG
ncbi:hypothetical protein [Aeromicrobium sp. UC242_57]|uniref:hypothetical protein n=1 Tax=Aeromicrobium sp. UC242_57 TaxID=3374624 RepID=UPI00379668AD